MKRLFVAALSVGVAAGLCGIVQAQDEGGAKPKHDKGPRKDIAKPPLVEMALTGKISKEERPGREGKSYVRYMLTDAQGQKAVLPGPKKAKEGEAAAPAVVNLEEYVGKDVTVTGKGFKTEKIGVTSVRIVEIIKVELVVPPAAPAAAPAAPAAAPVAPDAPAAQ
jgi:hypothetical protein